MFLKRVFFALLHDIKDSYRTEMILNLHLTHKWELKLSAQLHGLHWFGLVWLGFMAYQPLLVI